MYATVDEESDERVGEHVIFCLDISASMNHDAAGVHQRPKAPDHVASSIRQARALLRLLAFSTLKAGGSIDIVLWNFEIHKVISFDRSDSLTASRDFMRAEGDEFLPDDQIQKIIDEQTNEKVSLSLSSGLYSTWGHQH